MTRLLTLLLLALALGAHRPPTKPDFYKTKALPGDGVYSLLRRYNLDRNSCNISKFYALNDLKNGTSLKVGSTYSLPILIYDFDGKTIRGSVGIKDWETAKQIETYNEGMLKDGYRKVSFKKDNKLWVPYHVLNCPDKDVAKASLDATASNGEVNLAVEASGNRKFPIFGKKYEHVPLKSSSLAGKVYFIESGHGGPDPGAMAKVGKHAVCEDEYAYDVALRVVRRLTEHGATAYMITRDRNDGIRDEQFLVCDRDEVVWGNEAIHRGQRKRLFQRSDVINTLYEKHKKQGVKDEDQKLIVIHVDSRGKGEQTDLFFYYHPDDKQGKALAQKMHKSMENGYKKINKNRGYNGTVTARDLHMLRETRVPSAYIELGNIKHPTDQKRLFLPANRQLISDWLFEGMK
ncbi:MAG: N-acetylmuramoyl-L-alanine amidase [Saprospiraceae bacterium]|jgi:N-acetylmuramoyl-L-alanine amidase|nr:N-acetylmuramoyl-L-alanine amidase [Saprospiraceae bacterium]